MNVAYTRDWAWITRNWWGKLACTWASQGSRRCYQTSVVHTRNTERVRSSVTCSQLRKEQKSEQVINVRSVQQKCAGWKRACLFKKYFLGVNAFQVCHTSSGLRYAFILLTAKMNWSPALMLGLCTISFNAIFKWSEVKNESRCLVITMSFSLWK